MQKETRKKKTENRKRISPINSVINFRGNQRQPITRSGGAKRKSTTYVNFLTTNSIRNVKALKLNYLNKERLFQEGANPVDLIKKLYPIMKDDISIFLHTKSFNENTDPIDFLDWMFRCYEEIYSDIKWSLEDDGIQRMYDYQISEEGYSVGIDFFPIIKERNPMLYDLMTGAIGLLCNQFRIPCFWNDGFDYTDEMVKSELEEMILMKGENRDKDTIKRYKHYLKEYEKGNCNMVQNDIKEKPFNMKLYKLFKPKNREEKACKKFIENTLDLLAKYPETKFYDFYHATEDEFNDGSPVAPDDYAAIGWRYDDDDDPFSWHDSQYTQMNWENYGSIPFRWIEMNNEDKDESLFPYEWVSLLNDLQAVGRCY